MSLYDRYHELHGLQEALRESERPEKVRVCIEHRVTCSVRDDAVVCPVGSHELEEREWAVANAPGPGTTTAAPPPPHRREAPMAQHGGKRQSSVVDRRFFRDAAGNRLYLRLKQQEDGAMVIAVQHLPKGGGNRSGVLGHFRPGDDPALADRQAKARFIELIGQTLQKGWTASAGRRPGGLQEIPEAQGAAAAAAAPKRSTARPRPYAGRGR